MIIFLLSIKSFLAKVSAHLETFGKFIATFGAPGLFVLCVLDSTFVPLPSSADALLIFLSITNPHRMLFYVFLAVLGSITSRAGPAGARSPGSHLPNKSA